MSEGHETRAKHKIYGVDWQSMILPQLLSTAMWNVFSQADAALNTVGPDVHNVSNPIVKIW